ncbi:hypothetical protein Tco_0686294, partial [Tanacetum coccineum]
VVVRVENHENWSWFLGLLHDDLSLQHGASLTVFSDAHKGLLDIVVDCKAVKLAISRGIVFVFAGSGS